MHKILLSLIVSLLMVGTANAQSVVPGQRATHVVNRTLLSQPLPVTQGGSGVSQPGTAALQNLVGTMAQLPHWSKALANVISKKSNARILCVGDSNTFGYHSNNLNSGDYKTLSFCYQLANMLNGSGIPASTQNFIGNGPSGTNGNSANDSRITLGTGWTGAGASLGGSVLQATANLGTLSFAPTTPVDTFVVYYSAGGGIINYNFDGGGNTTINEGAGSYVKVVIPVPAGLGMHTINFTYSSGSFVLVDALEAYNSAVPQVLVDVAGWSGSTAANWNSTASATNCGVFAADLVIMNLGFNDMNGSGDLGTFRTNLQSDITKCQSSGLTDVLLMTANHAPSATFPEPFQNLYWNVVRSLAKTNTNSAGLVTGIPVADEFNNFGSYNLENASPTVVYNPGVAVDNYHMIWTGHAIMAKDLYNLISPGGSIVDNANAVVAGYTKTSAVVSNGTKFTTTGCSVSATTGGASAGTYTSGTTGTCTTVITMGQGNQATNGWACTGNDRTTPADVQTQTASTTTTATIAGTTISGDVVSFSCIGY